VNKHTCEFVICRVDLFDGKLNIQLQLGIKADGFLELKVLKLDVSIGSAKVSISFMNF